MSETLTNARAAGLARWETLERRLVADGSPWLTVWAERVRLHDGRIVEPFYSIEQPDFVVVFPVAPDGRVLTIWHYKHGPRRVNLGLPAGLVRPGEAPMDAARRELVEETGYHADQLVELGAFSVDGNRGCGRGHVFLATELRLEGEPIQDDLEELLLDWVDAGKLRAALRAGQVATMGAATGIAMGLLFLEEVAPRKTTSANETKQS